MGGAARWSLYVRLCGQRLQLLASLSMYVLTQRERGLGQAAERELLSIWDLPSQLPPVMTSLKYQPGFTPVPGQPGAFTVSMAPAGGVMAWLEQNKRVVFIAAGALFVLAALTSGGRRRRR